MYGNASEYYLNTAPEALEHETFEGLMRESDQLLVASAQKFKPKDVLSWRITEICWLVEYFKIGIRTQREYNQIPFRDRKIDKTSTIATSGGAILIAIFLEYLFYKRQSYTVEELAEVAVEKGYRLYTQAEDGSYISNGCKKSFFDKFVPSLYHLYVERADNVRYMLENIFDYKALVVLVSNKLYRNEENGEDSCFLLVLGYNENELTIFDPMESGEKKVPYEQVMNSLQAAWVFEKRKR